MQTARLQSGSPIFYLSSLPPITLPRLLPGALFTARLVTHVVCSAGSPWDPLQFTRQDTCRADHLEMASRQEKAGNPTVKLTSNRTRQSEIASDYWASG